MILYHVTTQDNYKKLMREGIKPYDTGMSNTKGIFLTDKQGVNIVAHYWTCWKAKNDPDVVALKLNIPDDWLKYKDGKFVRYGMEKAPEWIVERLIPPICIVHVFRFKCKRG